MPERPDLEKEDSSDHQKTLQAFSWYLAQATDKVSADLLMELSNAAGLWIRSKAWMGKLMLRMGAALTGDLEKRRAMRVRTTIDIALRQPRRSILG